MSNSAQEQKLLAYLRLSNEANKRHQMLLDKIAAEKQAVDAATPQAVQACVEHDRIFGHQKEAVAQSLKTSHAKCLEFIAGLAKHRNANELDAIGTQLGNEKTASARPRVTGARIADHDETDAGRKFREKLMGVR
jgi:hypothetical protein